MEVENQVTSIRRSTCITHFLVYRVDNLNPCCSLLLTLFKFFSSYKEALEIPH